jgi:hypothetical protein
MDSPVEMARDNHQEGHSGAAGGESRDIFSTDMDRILRAVWRDVQSVPRNVNLQSRWKLPSGRGLLAYVVRLCVGYLEARPRPRAVCSMDQTKIVRACCMQRSASR